MALSVTLGVCLGPGPALATEEASRHVVQPGQSLSGIAAQHGCTTQALLEANSRTIKDADRIRVGMKIVIPTCEASTRRPGALSKRCDWSVSNTNQGGLKRVLDDFGFVAPDKFRALVIKTTLNAKGTRIVKHEAFDYASKSHKSQGWNPASTVKLYSGIAALSRVKALGFSPQVSVTFHDEGGSQTTTLATLYEQAVHLSKNIAHNRLVQLAGFDYLNGPRGPLKRAGLSDSFIIRAYEKSKWRSMGYDASLRDSPEITLREGGKTRRLKAQRAAGKYPCWGAACTSIADLARTMCVLMLHEQLPTGARFPLGASASSRTQSDHLRFIRRRLNRKRAGKADPTWDAFARALLPQGTDGAARRGQPQLFRKAGFSQSWASDVLYIYLPQTRERWIVAMAARAGRGGLTKAAEALATVIARGEL